MYLQGLSRETYDLSVDGKTLHPKREDSRVSVAAFLRVLDNSNLDSVVESFDDKTTLGATLLNVSTGASAVLSVNYGGLKGYTAKVLMERNGVQQELAVDGGVDAAERKLAKVLHDPAAKLVERKKKKTTSFDLRAIRDEEYPYLEGKFRT
ncbi:Uncharacterised protein [uncultured archaeon]|nr:Uncharacterised protein [uncultured archaeon]